MIPVEINVPDTISEMAQGANQVYLNMQEWWTGTTPPTPAKKKGDKKKTPDVKVKKKKTTLQPKKPTEASTVPELRATESSEISTDFLYAEEEAAIRRRNRIKKRKDKFRKEKLRKEKLKKKKWSIDMNKIYYFFMGLIGIWPIPF